MIFAVLGDLHYFAEGGNAGAYLRTMKEDLARKNIVPDLIVQLGDVIENQQGPQPVPLAEGARQWRLSLQDIKTVFPETPFLITPGNHDWYGGDSWFGGGGNLRQYLVPFLEKELQGSLKGKLFFHVRAGADLLIFLNHEGMEPGMDAEQRRFLARILAGAEANPAVRNIWCFAHCGLWNVNYCRFQEHRDLLPFFTRCRKFRGYFAGHVHQNNISVRNAPGEVPILQAVAAGLKTDFNGVPLEAQQLILQPPPSVRQWAVIPESCPSYCLIRTGEEGIELTYEAIGGSTIARVDYRADGQPGAVVRTAPEADRSLPPDPVRARLYYYAYFPERHLRRTDAPELLFNGVSAGRFRTDRGSWHTDVRRDFLELPAAGLGQVNDFTLLNPMKEVFVVRDLFLEVLDRSGKIFYSRLCPKVLVSGKPDGIYMDCGLIHPDRGMLGSSLEENIPDEVLETVPPGETISFRLAFE